MLHYVNPGFLKLVPPIVHRSIINFPWHRLQLLLQISILFYFKHSNLKVEINLTHPHSNCSTPSALETNMFILNCSAGCVFFFNKLFFSLLVAHKNNRRITFSNLPKKTKKQLIFTVKLQKDKNEFQTFPLWIIIPVIFLNLFKFIILSVSPGLTDCSLCTQYFFILFPEMSAKLDERGEHDTGREALLAQNPPKGKN